MSGVRSACARRVSNARGACEPHVNGARSTNPHAMIDASYTNMHSYQCSKGFVLLTDAPLPVRLQQIRFVYDMSAKRQPSTVHSQLQGHASSGPATRGFLFKTFWVLQRPGRATQN